VIRTPHHTPILLAAPALVLLASGCHAQRPWVDSDGDGWVNTLDCAPGDEAIHPDAPEVCRDGLDNNCNGVEDEYCERADHLRYFEICGVNARNEVVCWHDVFCGTNEVGEVVCWQPGSNVPLLDPQLSMAELETWARFPCGKGAWGEVTCVTPVAVSREFLPDGETRLLTAWEISPAFRTLRPVIQSDLQMTESPAAEFPQ